MSSEIEYDYPSAQFFEAIESGAATLPVVDMRVAGRYFKKVGSKSVTETLPELMHRLKVEIARDFEANEDDADEVPCIASYVVMIEKDSMKVLTALRSKYGPSGRILYGTSVFRTDDKSFMSEASYADS